MNGSSSVRCEVRGAIAIGNSDHKEGKAGMRAFHLPALKSRSKDSTPFTTVPASPAPTALVAYRISSPVKSERPKR